MAERRRKRKKDNASNWRDYFRDIKNVCPWSYQAFRNDLIDFRNYEGKWDFDIQNYSARVWIVWRKPRLLKKWAERLNNQDKVCEWLWSHPDEGGDSSPEPCLIQQPRQTLEDIRRKIQKGV